MWELVHWKLNWLTSIMFERAQTANSNYTWGRQGAAEDGRRRGWLRSLQIKLDV